MTENTETSKRLVTEGYLDGELKKYPTRWEMIAYLAGAVVLNRFVESANHSDIPKQLLEIVRMFV